MTPDFKLLFRAMQLCNAVYEPDAARATAAFAALGADVLGRYCDAGHQAIACRLDGRATKVISGTRVLEGTEIQHIMDLYEDIDYSPRHVCGGIEVATGALLGLDAVWGWALGLFEPGEPIDVFGHSLGGQRTCLTPLFLSSDRIGQMVAFEPPKAGNAAFWAEYATDTTHLITVVNGRDPWAAWPWISEGLQHQPGPVLWLHDGTWDWATDWRQGDVCDWADHGPDTVLQALKDLAV